MTIPALRLSDAIIEAISAHADHYASGKVVVEAVLSALGDVASDFLAQIPDPAARAEHRHTLTNGITAATATKRLALDATEGTDQAQH